MVLTVEIGSPSALDQAVRALAAGELVVIPTDTVYGIAARLDRPESIKRIFECKKRPYSKPLAILVADPAAAQGLGIFSPEALELAAGGWPGALTLVVPAVAAVPGLGGDGTTVGLRIPDHAWTLALLSACGPLAVTSANPTGHPTGATIEQIVQDLGSSVGLYVDGGTLGGPPSTVIKMTSGQEKLR